MTKRYKEITAEELEKYKNLGGFHLLGSGRDKIEKPEHLAMAVAACSDLKLDALVVTGGKKLRMITLTLLVCNVPWLCFFSPDSR